MDRLDLRILDAVQIAVPLDERPFRVLAEHLGTTEDEVLDRLRALRASGLVRRISAIFDAGALGYRSALVALAVAQDHVDPAAERVNAHPGVSHNYQRDHTFNLWFTLTAPGRCDLRRHASALAEQAAAAQWLFLPSLRVFKLGVHFKMTDEAEGGESLPSAVREGTAPQATAPQGQTDSAGPLTEADRRAVRALQEDTAIEKEPFREPASRAGFSPAELLERAREMLHSGVMRRFAAVLHHHRAGYTHNILSAWRVPPSRAEEVGRLMAGFSEISHCYERATSPDWPYSHFAMIHARSSEEAQEVVQRIEALTGIHDRCLLATVREFKKTRVEYFTPEIDRWEKQNGLV